MSSNSSQSSVLVLGGGILGVSSAVHLLREGAQVTLITDTKLASGASGRSLSWLNSAGERTKPYHDLRMAGVDRYRTLFSQNPTLEWLRFDGGLFWDGNESSTVTRHEYELSHGYDSELVTPESVSAATPSIDSKTVADPSIFNPGEGWVSLPHLIDFLMEEFHTLGGVLVEDAGKSSVTRDDEGVTGVSTANSGDFVATKVVVACGPQTPSVAAELGVFIGDASPVSMLVITEKSEHGVQAVLNTPRVALRPNPGSTLALDHDWYEPNITQDGAGNYQIAESIVNELVQEASNVIAGNPILKANHWKIGLKPIPGDGEPVFGELESVSGCYVVFTHSGATLGLLAGELISTEVLTGKRHPMLETFRPERFALALNHSA